MFSVLSQFVCVNFMMCDGIFILTGHFKILECEWDSVMYASLVCFAAYSFATSLCSFATFTGSLPYGKVENHKYVLTLKTRLARRNAIVVVTENKSLRFSFADPASLTIIPTTIAEI